VISPVNVEIAKDQREKLLNMKNTWDQKIEKVDEQLSP